MRITDRFNGRVVVDAFRNEDGTITLGTSCGRTMRLGVVDGVIQEIPRTLVVKPGPKELIPPNRLRLLESFRGEHIDYVLQEDSGEVTFSCRSGRQITLTIVQDMIGDMPKVGCVVQLPSLSLLGKRGLPGRG